jgi:hypothetical protein
MRVLVAMLALAACAPDPVPVPPPPPPPPVPADLLSCPPAPPTPPTLPNIVTTDRLKQGFQTLDLSRLQERRRGAECADKLEKLNTWIKENRS